MRKMVSTLMAVCIGALLLTACDPQDGGQIAQRDQGRLQVVCSVYPVYDFTQKMAGDAADVSLLVPPGVEAHDWEPSPADIVLLEEADVLVLNGAGMEFWADRVLGALENQELTIVDSSAQITLRATQDPDDGDLSHDHDHEESDHADHGDEEADHDHDHGDFDPHVWLDPMNAQKQMQTIYEALAAADPDDATQYEERYQEHAQNCVLLDEAYRAALDPTRLSNRSIIVAHEAYGYLCDAYGLTQIGVEGLRPDSEPDPARMAEIVDLMRDTGIDTVFYETGASPKVAEAIARSTGARVDVLNPIEGLSRDEMNEGKDYFSEMRANLERLVAALG